MANYEELAQVEALKQIQSESLEIARLERDLHIFENWRDKLYFPEPKHPGEYKDVHFILKYIPLPMFLLSIILMVFGYITTKNGDLLITLGFLVFIISFVFLLIHGRCSPTISKQDYKKLLEEYERQMPIYNKLTTEFEKNKKSIVENLLYELIDMIKNTKFFDRSENYAVFKVYSKKKCFLTDEELKELTQQLVKVCDEISNNIETKRNSLKILIDAFKSKDTRFRIFAHKLKMYRYDPTGICIYQIIKAVLESYENETHHLYLAISQVVENIDTIVDSNKEEVYNIIFGDLEDDNK